MTKNILLTAIMENDVNNEEIRYTFLQTLYDRFYTDKPNDYVSTEELIKDAGLSNEDRNTVEANIVYLKNDYYIEGVGQLGSAITLSVKLNSSGLDFVEDRNQAMADYHGKLRFKVLSALYEFHFGGNIGRFTSSLELAEQLSSGEEEKKQILADIIYLGDRGYINPQYTSGTYYPRWISIQNSGIDVVDSIFQQSIEDLETAEIESSAQNEIEEIKNETDKKTKSEKFRDFLSRHERSATTIIVESINAAINSWLSSGGTTGAG